MSQFLNYSIYVKEKLDAISLYSEIIHKKSLDYSKLKTNISKLIMEYPYFSEALDGMLWFFNYAVNNPNKPDLLFVYRVCAQFMKYFSKGPYRTYVLECITEYLLKTQDNSADFVYFCDYILQFKTVEGLINKRSTVELSVVNDAISSGQVLFGLKKALEIYSRGSRQVKVQCLNRIVYVYEKLRLPELVHKYKTMLKDVV